MQERGQHVRAEEGLRQKKKNERTFLKKFRNSRIEIRKGSVFDKECHMIGNTLPKNQQLGCGRNARISRVSDLRDPLKGSFSRTHQDINILARNNDVWGGFGSLSACLLL